MSPNYKFFSEKQFDFSISQSNGWDKDSLHWRPATFKEAELETKDMDLGNFSAALNKADIVDIKSISAPGAQIWLPYGNLILNKFRDHVRTVYQSAQLEEYSYPLVVPTEIYSPTDHFHRVKEKILYVQSQSIEHTTDYTRNNFALNPTGESSIYWHWSSLVKKQQLPIRMYQRTSYFRPLPSNVAGGLFKGLEARDVFEFHCCHVNQEKMAEDIISNTQMLKTLYDTLDIPVIWSTRPLWTNNYKVHNGAFAADLYLPIGKTVQLSAVYQQDQIFSESYNIKVRQNGAENYTYHTTGYCSQRAMLAAILLASGAAGRLIIPATIAPHPIEIILNWDDKEKDVLACKIKENLSLIPRVLTCSSQKEITQALRKSSRQGILLTALIQNKRTINDKYKIILIRRDTNQEATVMMKELDLEFYRMIKDLMAQINQNISSLSREHVKKSIVHINNIKEIGDIKSHRGITIAPLKADETSVRFLESKIRGEVIGFVKSANDLPCLITDEIVATKAIIAKRL